MRQLALVYLEVAEDQIARHPFITAACLAAVVLGLMWVAANSKRVEVVIIPESEE